MSTTYRVETSEPCCEHCGAGGKYFIMGPGLVRPMGGSGKTPVTCEDLDATLEVAVMLNEAYALGHAAGHKELSPEAREILREDYRRELRREQERPESVEVVRDYKLDQGAGIHEKLMVVNVQRAPGLVRVTVA